MRIRCIPAALAVALIAGTPLAFAATPPAASAPANAPAQWSRHHGERMHHSMDMLDQLDLSAAQQASIKQLRHQSFQQARTNLQTLRQQRMAFENATPGSAGYQDAANALATAEANAAHARVLNESDLRSKIYNILTPAQRTKLASLRADRRAKMQQWRATHSQHGAAMSSTTPEASSN